jgi:mono/diheme cytochrome c family protein
MHETTNPAGRRAATLAALLVLLLISVLVPAQADKPAPARNDDSVYAELSKAPQKSAGRTNPLASDPEAVAAGAKLFHLHCAECHGEDAAGSRKAPSLRAPEVQQARPGAIFWLLTNGVVRRGMPVWSKLPEPQRWQVVSYIKSLTPVPEEPTREKPLELDPSSRPRGRH